MDIRILENGDLAITETIDYDFGTTPHHGIFRTIPTRLPHDDVSDRVYRIEDVSVESPTAPSDVEVSEEDGIDDDPHRGSRTWRSPAGTPTRSRIGSRVR